MHIPFRLLLALITWSLMQSPAIAAERIGVAVITDGPQYQLREVEDIFLEELEALSGREFELDIHRLPADWSAASVDAALQSAYADNVIDMILVLGFAGNQITISRQNFPKPTFLPLIFNSDLLEAPATENRSGRRNLNYLADRVPLRNDLATFQRVMHFNHAVILSDTVIIESIPKALSVLQSQSTGIRFSFVAHDGDKDLASEIPSDADAILLGGLPRLPLDRFDSLLEHLTERGLPVFSLVGDADVKRGALASDTIATDFRRLARLNALNMQAVMLGELAEDQTIRYDGKRQLTINMEVARKISLSPHFDVMSEARLINAELASSGPALTLESVARRAVLQNLDLAVSAFDVAIGQQNIVGARANLLPQVNVGASYSERRDEALARSAAFPQRATAGSVSLNQPLYVESARSGYTQEKLLQEGRIASLDSARLDSVLGATSAYLQALRAQNQLKIQQENLDLTRSNLELARDRVAAGSASNADVYRWEASLAEIRSAVLRALAAQQQSYDELNRVLNFPLGTTPLLSTPATNEPFAMTADEFDQLISNPRRFGWFIDFNIEQGLKQSPELAQLRAQISAANRDVIGRQRALWTPDVSLQAQYNDNLNASGLGSGSVLDELNDWSVSVNASWPLFDSGTRRSSLSRASLVEKQLKTQFEATKQRIEQNIRAAVLSAQASYTSIKLSKSGAAAARKNLALVSDAYRQGAVSIIDLLDAQTQSLQADLNARNSVHDFLLDIVNVQRATASFDFLLEPAEEARRAMNLQEYIAAREAQLRSPGVTP